MDANRFELTDEPNYSHLDKIAPNVFDPKWDGHQLRAVSESFRLQCNRFMKFNYMQNRKSHDWTMEWSLPVPADDQKQRNAVLSIGRAALITAPDLVVSVKWHSVQIIFSVTVAAVRCEAPKNWVAKPQKLH